jgi:hypothetical protein
MHSQADSCKASRVCSSSSTTRRWPDSLLRLAPRLASHRSRAPKPCSYECVTPPRRVRPRRDELTLFREQLKAVCVPLLEATRAPPIGKTLERIIHLLAQLRQILQQAAGADFTPALANYVFFPLSSLLQPPTAATALDAGGRPSPSSRGDAVLEATMLALESLIHVWRRTGMEPRVRQELWIMTILTLGGPLDPNKPVLDTKGKGKGKALEATEEAQLAMVKVLVALMRPIESTAASTPDRMDQDDDDDPLGERLDWSRVDPQDSQTFERGVPEKVSDDNPAPPPPTPILFHTLTTLLALASEPTSLLALQLSSLEALRILITHYLAGAAGEDNGPAPLLATALPGTASTLSRIATSRPSKSSSSASSSSSPSPRSANSNRPQASAIVVSALETLSLIIRSTLGDAVTEPLRRDVQRDSSSSSTARITSLEEIDPSFPMDLDAEAPTDDGADDFEPPPPPPTASSNGGTTTKGPTIPTPQWLRYTLSSLEVLFTALSPVAAHESPLVRAALVHFLHSVLSECGATLGAHAEAPLEGLLALAGDDWRDQVAEPARRALVRALNKARPSGDQGGVDDDARSLVSRIVQRRFASLPGAVRRRDELAIRRSASIVRVGLSLFLDGSSRDSAPNRNNKHKTDMQVLQSVEKWSWNLLSALELEGVAGSMASTGGQGGMALAWITTNATAAAGAGGGGDAATTEETSYPPTRLRGITDESTVRALEQLWCALGSSAASSGFGTMGGAESVVEHLLGFAFGPRRNEPIAASSLWALDGMLVGTKDYLSDKEQRRIYRHVTRAVVSLLDDLRRTEEEDSSASTARGGGGGGGEPDAVDSKMSDDDDAKELQRVEHRTGVLDLPSLDAYKPVVTRHASEQDRASQRILLTSWSLRLLATCANLLQSAFQPLLIQSLYHILELSSPTSPPLVAMHAQRALSIVSDSAGYASPQNLVLSNVDYVVNSVSQRLAVARLDPSAPLVLVEMIRLVGKPIVPMVQDLVDDVFEALDDYHGYEEVTVGLWAVLDALLKVMEEDLPPPTRNPSPQLAAPQATEDDWQALGAWVRERNEAEHGDETAADIAEEVNPQRPFKPDQGDDDGMKGATAQHDDEPTPDQVAPPTRTQVVTAQILSKALYFLSHDSPFLRARVLSLIASAVPLLALPDLDAADPAANRAADLMPVIHRAWPYILNRLSDPEPYVVVEAAGLVESLARNVGEFMSRRIVDDVWPRFKTLLGRLDVEDRKSALSTQDRHSTSFRIYRSILQTLGDAARGVPLKEDVLWDQAVTLRRFLSTEYHKDLQTLAAALYHSLGRLNADLVWLVLGATVRLDPSLPGYLAMEERFVGGNVRRVLADL